VAATASRAEAGIRFFRNAIRISVIARICTGKQMMPMRN
jgi:hypothetical protein